MFGISLFARSFFSFISILNYHLEQMAQAIFKSWFVDFEPWGGVMPEDWREGTLGEAASFVSGYSYKGSEFLPSNVAMATIKNFERKGGFKIEGFKEIVITGKIKPTQYVEQYDILVAHTDLTQNADVIGNAEMLMTLSGYKRMVLSLDLVKVTPISPSLTRFLSASFLRSPDFKNHALGYVNGTIVLHLSKKALPEYILALPEDETVLEQANALIEPLYLRIAENFHENERLSELRDTLLPRLMSGELSVVQQH
ncbi:MAG: hypothetical protein LBG81_06775 [Coriobacteriaceae bacterium]|nr:hypothetical protein [Coriobacteriaceae bacterium]